MTNKALGGPNFYRKQRCSKSMALERFHSNSCNMHICMSFVRFSSGPMLQLQCSCILACLYRIAGSNNHSAMMSLPWPRGKYCRGTANVHSLAAWRVFACLHIYRSSRVQGSDTESQNATSSEHKKGPRCAEYHSCKQCDTTASDASVSHFCGGEWLAFAGASAASGCFPRLSSYWQMPQAISRLSQSEVLMSFRRSARAKRCKP